MGEYYVNGYAVISLPIITKTDTVTVKGLYNKLTSLYICHKITYIDFLSEPENYHTIVRGVLYIINGEIYITFVDNVPLPDFANNDSYLVNQNDSVRHI